MPKDQQPAPGRRAQLPASSTSFPPLLWSQHKLGGAGGGPGAPTLGARSQQVRVKDEPGSSSVAGGLGGGTSVWLPAWRRAPAYASRHTVSFPFSTPCNWAHATAGSRDANDMLIRKLGSNSSLALTGAWGSRGPASPPIAGSWIPPYHRVLHPNPPRDPESHPTRGSCIPSCHRVLHPIPPWGPARDQHSPEPLPAPSSVPQQRDTHVFATDLILSELHLDEGPHGGEELPPGPALHPLVLLDVLLHAPDGQILDLHRVRCQHGVPPAGQSWAGGRSAPLSAPWHAPLH